MAHDRRGLHRRRLLQGIGATAGLAACGPGAPAGPKPTGKPTTSPTSPVVPGDIDTIVILMMENRSFDHVFGSLSLLEGRTDVDGLRADMANPDLDGNLVPVTPTVAPCVDPDPPHGWTTSRTQLDGGTNQGFVRAFLESRGASAPAHLPMTYQTRAQQPISYALADRYALCQRWFSSLLSSTWPNRLYFHAAQSQGIPDNSFGDGFYTCRTVWDQLDDAGVDWGYYFTDLPTVGLFDRSVFRRDGWLDRIGFMEQFYEDAAAGALPSVVCVDAGAGYDDDHPPHHPLLGQLFIGSIYAALAQSPHWERCLFLLTYDEAGGFFDHVVPGTMPDAYADQGFDQLGFRVPALLAGPYVRNVVSDERLDHTGAMTLIQDWFGIDERLTERNAASGDLIGATFDLDAMAAGTPGEPIALPVIERSVEEIEDECESLGRRTGQPELREAIRATLPHLDRTNELPAIARRAWERYGEQGLWVPTRSGATLR